MLGFDRNKLIGKRFNSFTPADENDIFNSFINDIFNSSVKHSCELTIVNKDKAAVQGSIRRFRVRRCTGTRKNMPGCFNRFDRIQENRKFVKRVQRGT